MFGKVYLPGNKIVDMKNLMNILRTKYWYLFGDEHLDRDFAKFQGHKLHLLDQNNQWKIFQIDGLIYYWPTEFSLAGLNYLYREVFAPYEMNPHAYEFKKIKVSESDWVIDAGASEGFFTRFALLKKANVIAIEPIPRLAEALQLTYKKEINEGKVIVLNVGLGEKSGSSQLQINDQQICSSTVSNGNGETVKILSIDDIYRQKITNKIDFVKMDIEGGEVDAILGAGHVIRELRPKLSIAIYHAYENASVIKNIVKSFHPKYSVNFRGTFIRDDFGKPRPYMLYAKSS